MNIREQRSQKTKETIIEVAIDLIESASFDIVTINQICNKANVTKGAFYHHFDSKSDIVAEYYKIRVLDNIDIERSEYNSTNTVELIEEITYKLLMLIHDQGLEFAKQIYKHQLEKPLKYYIVEGEKTTDFLVSLIQEGQSNREIRDDIDCTTIANLLMKFSRGLIYDWCINEGSYVFSEVAKKDFSIFIESLKYE
ncbi:MULTISPECIES: TetR/AcrR family transcriptional regulator [unclassified Fusibacter]|uniref:TetR/AcrR family transcriptional regulator n=1 Tax=unclassified Fusibacter TaxID=2624464 RepID=UPI0013E94E97|nr:MULTISPECIES: TetR/AcrR family transcriptional regulator [unclassified Fusibacter]MCK8060909.1 TetR/AcrR family transcriptional regulator [Fusibacter sp. A2]NPE23205.1 TetR/AcrR family transcriptional regulator [Fusibacter sp. A1]